METSGRVRVLTVQKCSVPCVGFEAYVCGAAPSEKFVLSGPAGRKSGLSVFGKHPLPITALPAKMNYLQTCAFLVLITMPRLLSTL